MIAIGFVTFYIKMITNWRFGQLISNLGRQFRFDFEWTPGALSIKEGLDEAFAPCEFYDIINGIPVYVMERAERMEKGITPSKETSEACEKDELDYSWDASLWEVFVQYYGIEFCKRLTTFLQDNYINDIRFDNCGMINGRPVLIDYCGYWED